MRRSTPTILIILGLALLLFALATWFRTATASAQELVTLTTPQTVTATTCNVQYVGLNPPGLTVAVQVGYNSGKTSMVVWGPTGVVVDGVQGAATPTGATLLNQLNTANFSAGTSFVKAVHVRLAAAGVCVGAVSGTPQ